MTQDRRAVIYARVSSDRQAEEGWSHDAQIARLREYADRNGLEVVREIVATESAAKAGRQAFADVVGELTRRGGPRVLLVEKADRATRNMRDFLTLDQLRQVDVEIHSSREGLVISSDSDPSVELMWSLQVAFARHYVANLSRETKKGQEQKRRAGGWPHLAPVGYLNQDRRLAVDPARAPLVAAVFRAYATGDHTLRTAAAFAKSIGLTTRLGSPLHPKAVSTMLRHPLYAGLIPGPEWNRGRHRPNPTAGCHEGEHEPLVDRETWLSG